MANNDQLDIETRLAEVLERQNEILSRQTSILEDQARLTSAMIASMTGELDQFSSASTRAGGSLQDILNVNSSELDRTSDRFTALAGGSGVLAGALSGLDKTGKLTKGNLGSIVDMYLSVQGAAGDVGKGIIELDATVAEFLVNKGSKDAANWRKNVQGEFVDLTKFIGKDFLQELTNFNDAMSLAWQKQFTDLNYIFNEATANMSRIFGSGPDGMKNMMEDTKTTIEALGPLWLDFSDDFTTSLNQGIAPALVVANRAFDLGTEGIAAFAVRIKGSGEDAEDAMNRIGRVTRMMAEEFGDAPGVIGKGFVRDVNGLQALRKPIREGPDRSGNLYASAWCNGQRYSSDGQQVHEFRSSS